MLVFTAPHYKSVGHLSWRPADRKFAPRPEATNRLRFEPRPRERRAWRLTVPSVPYLTTACSDCNKSTLLIRCPSLEKQKKVDPTSACFVTKCGNKLPAFPCGKQVEALRSFIKIFGVYVHKWQQLSNTPGCRGYTSTLETAEIRAGDSRRRLHGKTRNSTVRHRDAAAAAVRPYSSDTRFYIHKVELSGRVSVLPPTTQRLVPEIPGDSWCVEQWIIPRNSRRFSRTARHVGDGVVQKNGTRHASLSPYVIMSGMSPSIIITLYGYIEEDN
ncbi:hypothetical protein RRG08_014988 [Elysia crispata]|uniref:Uncharacterized protein n=1 Tax=Elysia crispata TaxID=231223 RepID=A0AAE0ZXY9_9GAST|nr:hypothetical protein RRG08_014988 [Elysia crispata]